LNLEQNFRPFPLEEKAFFGKDLGVKQSFVNERGDQNERVKNLFDLNRYGFIGDDRGFCLADHAKQQTSLVFQSHRLLSG